MVRCNTECPPRRGRRCVVRANAGVAAWVSTFEESMPAIIGAAMGLIPSAALPLLRVCAEAVAASILTAP
jgi:hypothetical protein